MFEGKVALITGSTSGIGYEIAEKLCAQKAKVVIIGRNQGKLNSAVDALKSKGYDVLGLPLDMSEEENVKRAIDETLKKYGRLDILINNAGVQHVSPIEDFPSEKFEAMIKLMLISPFYSIKYAFPIMKEQKYGRIINMASINGLVGFGGKAAYNSSKHGLIGLTKVSALEGAKHGITVNALCPGYVDTELVRNQLSDLAKTKNVPLEKVLEDVIYPLVPQKRLLDTDEVADYALFLSSDSARGVTGQAVVIDGGYTAQ